MLERSERHFGLGNSDAQPSVRISFAACTNGPCDSGKKVCPSPLACQQPERSDPLTFWQAVVELVRFWRP